MYTLKKTLVKPSNEVWFNESHPTESLALSEWIKTQPGFISINSEKPNENTLISTIVFNTQTEFTSAMTNSPPAELFVREQNFVNKKFTITKTTQGS
jgi:hypothetical protein